MELNHLYKEEQTATPEVYNAFIQRIQNIIRFTALGVWHYERKDGKPVKPNRQVRLSELTPVPDDEGLPF